MRISPKHVPSMESRGPCTYVTHGWGVHDSRWVAALLALSFEVSSLSLERDRLTIEDVNSRLDHGTGPVLAGPLDSVTRHLRTHRPVVGLSWGFDLIEARTRGDDLSWLTDLTGLVVDSLATTRIAQEAGVPSDRITVIPWGVDQDLFRPDGPAATPEDFGLPRESRLIVTLRAHEPRYRNSDVVRAFADLASKDPSIALILGHSGSQTSALRQLAEDLGVAERVRFLGTLAETDLPPLLRAAHVYVTASEVDGTSVTLLQAMACGAPVVASDSEGNRAWVEESQTGRLFGMGDVTDLTTAMQDALDPVFAAHTAAMAARAHSLVGNRADWSANRSRLHTAMARGS